MAALSNPTINKVKMTVDKSLDFAISSVASAAFYKMYMGSGAFDTAGAVTKSNSQRIVTVAAQNGGAGNPDVVHIPAGVIPEWPAVAYVITALDVNSANESSGTSHATFEFWR